MQQFDLFRGEESETATRKLLEAVEKSALFILPCGKRKEAEARTARELYTSPKFRSLRRIVEDLAVPYMIASAKHGLLRPDSIVEPYDLDLSQLPDDKRLHWASDVLEQLRSATRTEIVLLLNGEYADAIRTANAAGVEPLDISLPIAEMNGVSEDEWMRQANDIAIRIRDARKLYQFIESARSRGKTFLLRNLSEQVLPDRGVYVFLDPAEPSTISGGPRIVRIGTHAVSRGSSATLRGRLRNHMGTANGSGGHRGSVFRLHIGSAMLNSASGKWGQIPTWGIGQQASRDILDNEADLERDVSAYLANLEVFIIPINDLPSKESLRAKVETQLIGLMTANSLPLERPSSHWLGRHSIVSEIRSTGLWNVRDVGRPYWPSRKGSVHQIVSGKL